MIEKYRYYGKNEKGKLFKRVLTLTEIESGVFLVWVKDNKIIQNTITRDRFTGVVDKNKKEIYEGDIMKNERQETIPFEVIYHNGAYRAYDIFFGFCEYIEELNNTSWIIANKHGESLK